MDERVRAFARQVLEIEGRAVLALIERLGDGFDHAARRVLACEQAVVVTGVGKAGHVARKLSATLSSTGTPSHFLAPGDALHGDVGAVRPGDVVVILSASGESDEVTRLLTILKKLGNPVIGITRSVDSTLGRHADDVLELGPIEEACPLGLAPSASTTAMLAMGDALALTVMKLRDFTPEQFAMFHPAGQLGRKLTLVEEAMSFRRGETLPVASDGRSVGQVLHEVSHIKRRSGAVLLVDEAGALSGIFSDGDLRRQILRDDCDVLKLPIRDVMTRDPKRIAGDRLASEALAIMRAHRIDELPVVDSEDKPVGLIDVQDLVVLKMLDVENGGGS